MIASTDRAVLAELTPLARRVAGLDANAVVRLRLDHRTAAILARLPFGVLVARSVAVERDAPAVDVTVGAAALLNWLDDETAPTPPVRDADWRGGTPPAFGWSRLETVPDDVVRGLVRTGALAVKQAPHAAEALLDAEVLTVADGTATATLRLRTLSALTRMGFLPRGGSAAVDVAGRWIRVVGGYGTVYAERPGVSLTLR